MSADTDRVLERLLDEHPDLVDVDGPFDESVVADAEQALAVRFPPSYRAFLRQYGVLGLGGKEVYGLTRADRDRGVGQVGAPSTVGFTLGRRADAGLPAGYVVLVNDEGVEFFCINTDMLTASGECPVVVWNAPTRGVVQVRVAASFDDYLRRLLAEFEESVADA